MKICVRRKKFVLRFGTVHTKKFSFTNDNRATKTGRIPQDIKSSISKSVKRNYQQAPSASRRDAAAGIS
jgi:hypothetical protein